MENNKKTVKLYSNNSKKARIRRKKNKFQRIWDEKTCKYIKIKKTKFSTNKPQIAKNIKLSEEEIEKKISALTIKKTKKKNIKAHTPVEKTERHITTLKKSANGNSVKKDSTIHCNGKDMIWDTKTLRYKAA